MTLDIKEPDEIYHIIFDVLDKIINSLQEKSSDKAFDETQADALKQLKHHQAELRENLVKLEKNAEWDTFTIAFYGETGSGKSSIIETMRILLREPSKQASQQTFRELQDKYGLSENNLQHLKQDIMLVDKKLAEIIQQITCLNDEYEHQNNNALKHIEHLQIQIFEYKRTASFWQKLLLWFKKLPEEIELVTAKQKLEEFIAKHDNTIRLLLNQQTEIEQQKQALVQKRQTFENHLNELDTWADGAIIGDGRCDFTRKTQRYNLELDGQKFALLDVPGIEGKEGLVLEEIEHSIQIAHAVFYVTNQAAPPQTGDEQHHGTLEKIKKHLKDQTEIWTLFNKKIINPIAIKSQPLLNDDELTSLAELDKKMYAQLGKNHRTVFSLSILSAFLASTTHFVPNSQNAKRRKKFLERFDAEELLEISHVRAFIQMLREQLLNNSETKIKAANFSQVKGKVDESNEKVRHIQQIFSELAEQLELDSNNYCKQLLQSFNMLKYRLDALTSKLVDELVISARSSIYKQINDDISNDCFKEKLNDCIKQKQEQFIETLPEAILSEVEIFKQDTIDIMKRFEEYSQELAGIYEKLAKTKISEDFEINIKLDSGINVWKLVGGLVGLVAAPVTGGASLWITGVALLTSLVSISKVLVGYFSTSYKQSQQCKATNENLQELKSQLQTAFRSTLEEIMPKVQQTIDQLEQALKIPANQAAAKAQLLKDSTKKLDFLSQQISNAGNLS